MRLRLPVIAVRFVEHAAVAKIDLRVVEDRTGRPRRLRRRLSERLGPCRRGPDASKCDRQTPSVRESFRISASLPKEFIAVNYSAGAASTGGATGAASWPAQGP